MEHTKLLKPKTYAPTKKRLLIGMAVLLSAAIVLFLAFKTQKATEVNAAETKEQLNDMLDDLERMNSTIAQSQKIVKESAKDTSTSTSVSHETTNLKTLQTDIYETQNEITNLLQEIDEGKITALDEKLTNLQKELAAENDTYQTAVTSLKEQMTAVSGQDQKIYQKMIAQMEEVNLRTDLIQNSQNQQNEKSYGLLSSTSSKISDVLSTLDGMNKTQDVLSENQKETISFLERMSEHITTLEKGDDSLTGLLQEVRTHQDQTDEKVNGLAENQEAYHSELSQKQEDTMTRIEGVSNELKEQYDSVFQSVSSGKKYLATTLLTDGFDVAELTKENLEERAPYVGLQTYADAIEAGMSGLRDKAESHLGNNSGFQTLDDIEKGMDDIAEKNYDTGYTDGKTKGTKEGYDKGYSEGKTKGTQEGYTSGVAAGKAEVMNSGAYTLRRTNNYSTSYQNVELEGIDNSPPMFLEMTVKNTSNKGEIVVIHQNFVWPAGNSVTNGFMLNTFDSSLYLNSVFLNPGGSCTCKIHNFKINYNNYIEDCGGLVVYDVAY